MDRIGTPTGVITKDRPAAGLIDEMERDDDARGPMPDESESEGALRVVIPSAVGGTSWR
ncbi:hypothetical protein ACFXCZ_35430 [Streptomyces sp. NPDC059396]|uniref:hypothetical protein n=1 Tax=Streptomyces sp. NPDC059396 TaxID=3346819 RepID=UPI003686166B